MNKLLGSACLVLLALSSQAQVTNFTWTPTTGTFSTAGNWVMDQPAPNTPAPRAPSAAAGQDFAVFQGGISASLRTVDLAATARNVRGFRFDSVAGANAFTFNVSGLTTQTSFGLNMRQDGILNNDDDTQVFNTPLKLFTYAGGTPALTTIFTFNAAAGGLNFSGNFTGSSTKAALDLNNGQLVIDGSFNTSVGGASVAGVVGGIGRLVKNGSGTLTLAGTAANTYSSGTIINAGLVNANKANALGTSFLSVLGGTLSIGANNQTVGAVTNAGTINGSGTITGTSYRLLGGTVNANLAGSGINLVQASGTSTLGGNNTYSGTTTVTGGTLQLGASDRIANTSNMILNGGTFGTGGFNETLGTLSLTANSIIDFGAGNSALTFADSSALSWGSFNLDIINWTLGSDTLQIGIDNNGITGSQLGNIYFPDLGVGAVIDANGFVSPIPEPSTLALGLVGGLGLFAVVRRRRA